MKNFQTLQDGVSEFPHQRQTESLELVFLDKFVQIHGEEFEGNTNVVPEGKCLDHMHDIVHIVLVLLTQVLQDSDLFLGLTMKTFLVTDHFERDVGVRLVIVRLHDLSEAALADNFQHLVSVGDMIVRHVDVLSGIVVISAVLGTSDHALPLFRAGSQEVNLRVVEDLVVLVRGQFVHVVLHGLFWTHVRQLGALVAGGSRA